MPLFRSLVLGLVFATQAPAATILVNSESDSVSDDGRCTLREAIVAANSNAASGAMSGECAAGASAGQDSIKFDIPGPGPHTIVAQTQLPTIQSSLSIDGYTESGAQENTVTSLTGGFDAVLMIRLTGAASVASRPGLSVSGPGGSDVRIRGLEIFEFTSQGCCADSGIFIGGSTSNVEIVGNLIHDNLSRGVISLAGGGQHQGLRIGGPAAADRNLIYGNTSAGISLNDCQACLVENNWLGVRMQGASPAAAGNDSGLFFTATPQTVIRDNWIAANFQQGIGLYSNLQQTTVRRNLIGGGFANGIGVRIYNNSANAPANNQLSENQITGNNGVGVAVYNNVAGNAVTDNLLRNNRIYANGGLEIDLGANGGQADGVNPNDPGDLDAGPNGRQNSPVLGVPVVNGPQFSVGYSVDSTAATYTLEFAFASQCDASGFGLAGQMLSDPVVLDAMAPAGTAKFTLPQVPATGFVSALASGNDGTSEYSACQPYTYVDTLLANGFE